MSFLAPIWLGAAVLGALGVVALHLITTQRPPSMMLPTARFVPEGDSRASSRAARPTDLPLLLLRCAAILLLGAAFAGPVSRTRGAALARVIVVDRSRGALPDVRDSALALVRAGDVLVLFDSSAVVVTDGAADSLRSRTFVSTPARGSISAALVAAQRAGRDLARRADSVELAIVSPLTSDELDAASAATFARWPGRARFVRTAPARTTPAVVTLVSDEADDALRPPIAALNARAAHGAAFAAVRVVRRAPLHADSVAARDSAVAIVSWPRAGSAPTSAEGVWAGYATVVAPFVRLSLPPGGRTVGRWADGERAAAEWPLGRGCIRAIGVGVPVAGDITLQPAFTAVAQALLAPCYPSQTSTAAPDSIAKLFAHPGGAATATVLRASDESSPLAPWLLGAALFLLIGESFVRRGPAETAA